MTTSWRRILVVLTSLLLGVPLVLFSAFLAFLFAPAVDQLFNLGTGRALRTVQNHREGSRTVKEIVERRYRSANWHAYHRDYLEETYVRCDAVTASGETVALVWVVIQTPKVQPWRPHITTVATAHDRAAYAIAPSLYIQGHTLSISPDYANW